MESEAIEQERGDIYAKLRQEEKIVLQGYYEEAMTWCQHFEEEGMKEEVEKLFHTWDELIEKGITKMSTYTQGEPPAEINLSRYKYYRYIERIAATQDSMRTYINDMSDKWIAKHGHSKEGTDEKKANSDFCHMPKIGPEDTMFCRFDNGVATYHRCHHLGYEEQRIMNDYGSKYDRWCAHFEISSEDAKLVEERVFHAWKDDALYAVEKLEADINKATTSNAFSRLLPPFRESRKVYVMEMRNELTKVVEDMEKEWKQIHKKAKIGTKLMKQTNAMPLPMEFDSNPHEQRPPIRSSARVAGKRVRTLLQTEDNAVEGGRSRDEAMEVEAPTAATDSAMDVDKENRDPNEPSGDQHEEVEEEGAERAKKKRKAKKPIGKAKRSLHLPQPNVDPYADVPAALAELHKERYNDIKSKEKAAEMLEKEVVKYASPCLRRIAR